MMPIKTEKILEKDIALMHLATGLEMGVKASSGGRTFDNAQQIVHIGASPGVKTLSGDGEKPLGSGY